MSKETYISTKTAADELDLAVRTVQEWCKQKRFPVKKMGKDWRIPRSAWEEFKARLLKEAA